MLKDDYDINIIGRQAYEEETGEITRIYPPARSSKTSVIVTLPR